MDCGDGCQGELLEYDAQVDGLGKGPSLLAACGPARVANSRGRIQSRPQRGGQRQDSMHVHMDTWQCLNMTILKLISISRVISVRTVRSRDTSARVHIVQGATPASANPHVDSSLDGQAPARKGPRLTRSTSQIGRPEDGRRKQTTMSRQSFDWGTSTDGRSAWMRWR